MKIFKCMMDKILITLLALCLASSVLFAATSQSAKQLEKGKELYAQDKNEEAMEAFIDVLVNGSRAEVEEANKYLNLIHNRIGGIQDPVEVAADFQEGAVQRLQEGQDPVVLEQQLKAESQPIEETLREAGLVADAAQDQAAMTAQQAAEAEAAAEAAYQEQLAAQQAYLQEQAHQQALLAKQRAEQLQADAQQQAQTQANQLQAQTAQLQAETEAIQAQTRELYEQIAQAQTDTTQQAATSTYADLSSSSAIQARQIYTNQKLESMRQAAIAKLENTKGVRLYFRNGLPDAIDIDSDILFDGYKFRTDATPVLNEIYTLMALTQGAGYVILPPGSYTDDITLSGIRQAMALNSYLVHKGLSSGKISYNMGLYDEEPPAKFANLDGLSIVFDFDADLPSSMPDATSVSKLPLLSMAIVPVSNKIDPAAGEAFAIDFSVIETANPLESWVFQVVQHAGNDTYYVVRQLDGFAPVYHQVLWNGRKGIIGPQLACGMYTVVLTATDVQGGKRTLRRQIEVACSTETAAKTTVKKAAATTATQAENANLNYKAARLWTKPGRVMKGAPVAVNETEPDVVDPFAPVSSSAETVPAAAPDGYDPNSAAGQTAKGEEGVSNPYDMPYEEF